MARTGKAKVVVSMNWDAAADSFMLFKRAQGLADRTLEEYEYHLRRFATRCAPRFGDFAELKRKVLAYFAESASAAPSTFNFRRRVLRVFFEWAVTEGLVPSSPMVGITKRKENDVPRLVDEEVMKRLLKLPDVTTFAGLRDLSLMVLTMDTGIRPKEAFGLKVDDINLRGLEVFIQASVAKTRVSRTLPISPVTAEYLKKLVAARHEQWRDDVPLFCTENGRTMTRFIWNARMGLYSRQLGAKVRPYDLRHSFAVYYLRQGGNAFGLQRTLGHTTLTMTRRYVSLTERDLKQMHALASPVSELLGQAKRVRKVG
jgi:site-specific recombinase XerD